jgi:nucleoside deoxyribosyltransferase
MKTKVYLAAPWFTEKQEEIYNKVVRGLRTVERFELLLPRDFVVEDGNDISNALWAQMVFEHDRNLIDRCDVVYAIDWGFESDAGTAWEIGYAHAKNIPIVIVRPREVKRASLMVGGCCMATVDETLHYMEFGKTEYK